MKEAVMSDENKAGKNTGAVEGGANDLAEQEFNNYCDANEIDRELDDMEDEDRESFIKIKKRFMKAVKEKRVVVDGVKLQYTVSKFSPSQGQPFTISRPTGKDFMAMDGFKDNQQMNKFNGFIASIAGTERSTVARLDIVDRQFLQDIGTLFLAG
jgi:hypothetical protein